MMMPASKPAFSCGNCSKCGSRWHLDSYCPYEHPRDTIVLTKTGEALEAYPNSDMKDDHGLSSCIAVHYICNGFIDLKEVSRSHNAICCRACHLRVLIPNTIETFGELREWAAKEINNAS